MKKSGAPAGKEPQRPGVRHRRFYKSLGADSRMLLALRDELYGGSRLPMLRVLRARLKDSGTHRLVRRVRADMARIKRLREYEARHGIDMAHCLE